MQDQEFTLEERIELFEDLEPYAAAGLCPDKRTGVRLSMADQQFMKESGFEYLSVHELDEPDTVDQLEKMFALVNGEQNSFIIGDSFAVALSAQKVLANPKGSPDGPYEIVGCCGFMKRTLSAIESKINAIPDYFEGGTFFRGALLSALSLALLYALFFIPDFLGMLSPVMKAVIMAVPLVLLVILLFFLDFKKTGLLVAALGIGYIYALFTTDGAKYDQVTKYILIVAMVVIGFINLRAFFRQLRNLLGASKGRTLRSQVAQEIELCDQYIDYMSEQAEHFRKVYKKLRDPDDPDADIRIADIPAAYYAYAASRLRELKSRC